MSRLPAEVLWHSSGIRWASNDFHGRCRTSNTNGNSGEVTRDEKNISSRGIMVLSASALMAGSAQRWIHVRVESANGGNNNVSIND